MTLNILNRINYGWDELEPTILGLMAMGHSFMLIGPHGTGKTRVARALSMGYGGGGFAFYDATKDDLISIAGIPDTQGFKEGDLRFVRHQRSIWDKTTIVVDEITRAGKENQNLWLEILEDHTCFGLPLSYRTLIATANPESYAAAFQLDEALLDRFHAVLPVPELQAPVDLKAVMEMLRLSSPGAEITTPSADELRRVFEEIRRAHQGLLESGSLARVHNYLAQLVPELLRTLSRGEKRYVSVRTYARKLPEALLAVAAYHTAAGAEDALRLGAVDALRYAVATKLQINPTLLDRIHASVADLLEGGSVTGGDELHFAYASLSDFSDRLSFAEANWEGLRKSVGMDGMEKVVGELLSQAIEPGQQKRLVQLHSSLGRIGYKGDGVRQVEGRLALALQQALRFCSDPLADIAASVPDGDVSSDAQETSRLLSKIKNGGLLADHSPSAHALKDFLIQCWGKNEAPDVKAIRRLVSHIRILEAA